MREILKANNPSNVVEDDTEDNISLDIVIACIFISHEVDCLAAMTDTRNTRFLSSSTCTLSRRLLSVFPSWRQSSKARFSRKR